MRTNFFDRLGVLMSAASPERGRRAGFSAGLFSFCQGGGRGSPSTRSCSEKSPHLVSLSGMLSQKAKMHSLSVRSGSSVGEASQDHDTKSSQSWRAVTDPPQEGKEAIAEEGNC